MHDYEYIGKILAMGVLGFCAVIWILCGLLGLYERYLNRKLAKMRVKRQEERDAKGRPLCYQCGHPDVIIWADGVKPKQGLCGKCVAEAWKDREHSED